MEDSIATVIIGSVGVGVVLTIDTNIRASRTLDEQMVSKSFAGM